MLGGFAAAKSAPAIVMVTVHHVEETVTACLLLVVVRPMAKRHFTARGERPRMGTAGHVGRTADVVQTVTATSGLVRIGGEVWSARTSGDAIPEGETARVTAIDGATAVVTRDHVALN